MFLTVDQRVQLLHSMSRSQSQAKSKAKASIDKIDENKIECQTRTYEQCMEKTREKTEGAINSNINVDEKHRQLWRKRSAFQTEVMHVSLFRIQA
mmetsp:Transcript_20726/g.25132  ORF Transcript_20726/g.25132 Transcript_20726/m.25132 type:complete len:95 (+) Transcript_20726:133-417(+)